MMLGMQRPAPFREESANKPIPGYVTGYGSQAIGVLVGISPRGIGKARVQVACNRCGGGGGSDKWDHTGWTCFDCNGTGKGPVVTRNVYQPEAYAKLQARREKLATKREAIAAAAEEARRAPFLAWAGQHEHVLAEIRRAAPQDLIDRIEADCNSFRIPAPWLLDVSVATILRNGLREDIKAASRYVGEVGKRVDLTLTCEKLLDFSERGPNGYLLRAFYIALMRDEAGNRIVYKGGNPPIAEGDTVKVRATVKEHGERDGEKQTVIQRARGIE